MHLTGATLAAIRKGCDAVRCFRSNQGCKATIFGLENAEPDAQREKTKKKKKKGSKKAQTVGVVFLGLITAQGGANDECRGATGSCKGPEFERGPDTVRLSNSSQEEPTRVSCGFVQDDCCVWFYAGYGTSWVR